MKGGGENCTRAKDCEYRGVSQGQVVKKLEQFLLINLHHGSFAWIGRLGVFFGILVLNLHLGDASSLTCSLTLGVGDLEASYILHLLR